MSVAVSMLSCSKPPPPRADCPTPKACVSCPPAPRTVCPICECAFGAPAARPASSASSPPVLRSGAKSRHIATLDTVPTGTAIAITVDIDAALRWVIDGGLGSLPSGNSAALRARLSESLASDLGVDLTRSTHATAWLVPATRGFAIWMDGDFGAAATHALSPASRATQVVAGAPALALDDSLWLTMMGGRAIIGNAEGLRLSRSPGLTLQADFTTREAHTRALGHVDDGPVVASLAMTPGAGGADLRRAIRWFTGLEPDDLTADGAAFVLGADLGVDVSVVGQHEPLKALSDALTRLAPRWRAALVREIAGEGSGPRASLVEGLLDGLRTTSSPGLIRVESPALATTATQSLLALILTEAPRLLRGPNAREVLP